jgi:hypothetical protein
MGDVVNLPVITTLDLPPERILQAAMDKDLDEVVIVGFDKNGELYFASNKSDGGGVLWLFELAKKALLEVQI